MTTRHLLIATLLGAASFLTSSCKTVNSNGYYRVPGNIYSTSLTHNYTSAVALRSGAGKTYSTRGGNSYDIKYLPALESAGLSYKDRSATYSVDMKIEDVKFQQASTNMFTKKWHPVVHAQANYSIELKTRSRVISKKEGDVQEMFAISSLPGFDTQEQAEGAMHLLRQLKQDELKSKMKTKIKNKILSETVAMQRDLTQPRTLSVTVMLPTTADGTRFEGAESLLKNSTKFSDPNKVQQALSIYQTHLNSSSQLASYAAHVGTGVCYLMLNDLQRAWIHARQAQTIVPSGKEHASLVKALTNYEQETGQQASNSMASRKNTHLGWPQ